MYDCFLLGNVNIFEGTEAGGICSDIGGIILRTSAECREAAIAFEHKFKRSENEENYPKGCYTTQGNVYWNMHEVGNRRDHISSICKKGM